MKRLITILFLVIMTAQAVGLYRQPGNMQYASMHNTDEKHNDGTKEFKKEGLVVSVVVMVPLVLLKMSAFKLSKFIIISAPVIDHFGPPPERDIVN